MPTLFDPVRLGDLSLRNRIVMAPMTRSRAGAGDAPTEMNVEYYRQRASAGLIVTEGTQPSASGKGYCRTPGIHTPQQVRAWRAVTDAVHREGGCIVIQLMHCGRIASHHNKDSGTETVAPSAIRAAGKMYTDAAGMVEFDEPRALALEEIPGVIDEYRHATRCALAAGFDGVELHCGSGYLPEQFLTRGANHRTDRYGGSAANRARFILEALAAMSEVAGSGRVGLRLRPGNDFNDTSDADPAETYGTLLEAASALDLAYLHLIWLKSPQLDGLALARERYRGSILLNDGLTPEAARQHIANGSAAAVSFARHYIGNPDLVRRLKEGLPLAGFDRATLYTTGPKGYTDYPALD